LQETEVYSKLYYKDRISAGVAERIKTLGQGRPPTIKVIREVTKELYEGEEDEIKMAVATRMAAAQVEAAEVGAAEEPPRTPQQYQE
jgi:hypothetical protein